MSKESNYATNDRHFDLYPSPLVFPSLKLLTYPHPPPPPPPSHFLHPPLTQHTPLHHLLLCSPLSITILPSPTPPPPPPPTVSPPNLPHVVLLPIHQSYVLLGNGHHISQVFSHHKSKKRIVRRVSYKTNQQQQYQLIDLDHIEREGGDTPNRIPPPNPSTK